MKWFLILLLINIIFVFISSQLKEEDIDSNLFLLLDKKDVKKFEKSFKKLQKYFRILQDTSGGDESEESAEESSAVESSFVEESSHVE